MNLSPWMFLIFVNIFLLLFGIFIEPLHGVMVLAPVAVKLGIDPVHFALIVIYNLMRGMMTASLGRTAFRYLKRVASAHGPAGTRACSFLWAHGAVLVLLTFLPVLGTWLPRALGF